MNALVKCESIVIAKRGDFMPVIGKIQLTDVEDGNWCFTLDSDIDPTDILVDYRKKLKVSSSIVNWADSFMGPPYSFLINSLDKNKLEIFRKKLLDQSGWIEGN
jgi:hypothetical protein